MWVLSFSSSSSPSFPAARSIFISCVLARSLSATATSGHEVRNPRRNIKPPTPTIVQLDHRPWEIILVVLGSFWLLFILLILFSIYWLRLTPCASWVVFSAVFLLSQITPPPHRNPTTPRGHHIFNQLTFFFFSPNSLSTPQYRQDGFGGFEIARPTMG